VQIRGRIQPFRGGSERLGCVPMVGRLRAQHLDRTCLPVRVVVAAMAAKGEVAALAGVRALGVRPRVSPLLQIEGFVRGTQSGRRAGLGVGVHRCVSGRG